MRKSVVVTGVSTGIGEGTARVLAAAGWTVFGSVRKEADAQRLATELGTNFHSLIFDVTDEEQIARAAKKVREVLGGRKLDGLVNNAGISIAGPLELMPTSDFRAQIDTNLVGPFLVARAFIPLLGSDASLTGTPGKIVNISSIGGQLAAPFIGAYTAAKHGLEGMSESLRRELMLFGIDVVIVGPGSVATPIWTKTGGVEGNPYARSAYGPSMKRFFTSMVKEGLKGYPPEHLGKRILEILEDSSPRHRVAVVPGRLLNWTIPMSLPRRWLDKGMARMFGLRPRDLARSAAE